MKVIVAHPNAQHSHRLALAVQKAGWLEAYVTQLYYDRGRWPYRIVSLLPVDEQLKIDNKLYRRKLDGLDPKRVITYNLWAEMFFVLLNRVGLARSFREQWLFKRSRDFSRRVGKLAVSKANMIISTDSASLDTFRIAKSGGLKCILDLSHPHINTCLRIEEEERKCEPEFSETFDTYALNEEDLIYLREEVKLADAHIVASAFSQESLIENGVDEDRIYKIPYGVDLERFRPSDKHHMDSNKLRVLFVGRIGQRKGIGYLLRAIQELSSSVNIEAIFVGNLVGNISIYKKYQSDFSQHNRLPDSIYPDIYHNADVFVLPSLVEGFGLVLLEAMASGLPVITTPNTGGRDIITDGKDGYIIPIRDVNALKQRLQYLYDHPRDRVQMGVAAREIAEKYPWERYYSGVKEALTSIYNKKSVHSK